MIGKRYIDGDKLVEQLPSDLFPATPANALEKVKRWLKRQPKAPKLIGRQRAADIIGVGSPYITVLVEKGDLTPVSVDGGPDVYDEGECKAFAKAYKKRQRKRNGAEKEGS